MQTAKFGGGNIELGPQWALSLDFNAPEDIQNPLLPLIQRCNITLRDIPFGELGARNYNSRGEDITAAFGAATARYFAALSPESIQSILDALEDGADLPFTQALRMGGWNARTPLEEHVEFINFDAGPAIPADLSTFREIFDPELFLRRLTQFGTNITNYIVIYRP